MKYEGMCHCGKVRVEILSEPFLKYNCHCSHCRAFASKYESPSSSSSCSAADDAGCGGNSHHHDAGLGLPYHPGVFVWRWSVVVEEEVRGQSIEYEYSSSLGGLFGLARGRCRSCKQPVWERGRRLAAPYAMVMAPPLRHVVPDTNIFYNSGLQLGTGGASTTIYTDLGSWLYEIWVVLTVAVPQIPSSLFDFLFAERVLAGGNHKEE
jgi:hypothetical protein